MTAFFFDPRLLRTATLVTALSVSLMGCSDDKDTDSAGGDADAGESAIGNPVGDPIDIDHETAAELRAQLSSERAVCRRVAAVISSESSTVTYCRPCTPIHAR